MEILIGLLLILFFVGCGFISIILIDYYHIKNAEKLYDEFSSYNDYITKVIVSCKALDQLDNAYSWATDALKRKYDFFRDKGLALLDKQHYLDCLKSQKEIVAFKLNGKLTQEVKQNQGCGSDLIFYSDF